MYFLHLQAPLTTFPGKEGGAVLQENEEKGNEVAFVIMCWHSPAYWEYAKTCTAIVAIFEGLIAGDV